MYLEAEVGLKLNTESPSESLSYTPPGGRECILAHVCLLLNLWFFSASHMTFNLKQLFLSMVWWHVLIHARVTMSGSEIKRQCQELLLPLSVFNLKDCTLFWEYMLPFLTQKYPFLNLILMIVDDSCLKNIFIKNYKFVNLIASASHWGK